MKKTTHDLPFDLQWQIRREVNFFFKFAFHPRKHSSITSAKNWVGGWVGGVRKWQILLIYSTYADVGGWAKIAKHMVILPGHQSVTQVIYLF